MQGLALRLQARMLLDHSSLPRPMLSAYKLGSLPAQGCSENTWLMIQAEEVPERKAAHLRRGHGHSKAAGAHQGRAPRLEGEAAAERASKFQQIRFCRCCC